MSFYQINQKQPDGYYHIPRIGKYAYKTKDVRDPKIKEIIDEIKRKTGDQAADVLEAWGLIDRDSKGNYANVPEEFTVIENDEEIEAKNNFDKLVKDSTQFTIDPNYVNKDAISELLRNLPRNKQYLISQGNTTYTMNDQVRNKIVHQLVAHQSISETSSESWMESAVSGGVPFTISEHVYFQEGGYDFKEGAFLNYLFIC